MVELRELECFLVLAEELHFGRTAERLRVSQARVSQNIRALERRVGAPLFERTSRRVRITPLGEELFRDVEPAYRQIGRSLDRVTAAARGTEGELRVGFLGSAANEHTPHILDEFRSRHPDSEVLMIEVHCGNPLGPLRACEVDVLFTRLPVDEPDLTVGPIVVSEPRALAVPIGHPFAKRESVSVEDLARDTVIDVTGPAPDYWWDFHVPPVTPSGKPIRRWRAVATFQELLALVATAQGISPVVESVSRYYARPDIALVPMRDMPNSEVALVWRSAGATARVRAFAQAAADVVHTNGGLPHPAVHDEGPLDPARGSEFR